MLLSVPMSALSAEGDSVLASALEGAVVESRQLSCSIAYLKDELKVGVSASGQPQPGRVGPIVHPKALCLRSPKDPVLIG